MRITPNVPHYRTRPNARLRFDGLCGHSDVGWLLPRNATLDSPTERAAASRVQVR
jgi:hypothetical protein